MNRPALAIVFLFFASTAAAQYNPTYPEVRPSPVDNLPLNDVFVSLVKVPIVVNGEQAEGDQVTVRAEVKVDQGGCGVTIDVVYQPVGAAPSQWASLLQNSLHYQSDGTWQLVQFSNVFLPLGERINVGLRVTNATSNLTTARYKYNVETQ